MGLEIAELPRAAASVLPTVLGFVLPWIMMLNPQSGFNDFDEESDYFFDQYPALMLMESVSANVFELYQPFLLRVPSGGRILDAGIGEGRDSWYFTRHGYEVTSFWESQGKSGTRESSISSPVRNMKLQAANWDRDYDGIWAFGSLEELPQKSIDSVLENLCSAMKPTGVLLACFQKWGADWETSPERPGCNAVNLLRLVRKHPRFLLDAIWESRCGLNVMLLRR